MKNVKGIVITFLAVFFIMGVSVAYGDPLPSAGYPSVSVFAGPTGSVGVVSKYEASSFTSTEAEALSAQVATIISTLLGSSVGLDNSASLLLHLTPSEITANFGITSADAFAAFAQDNYKAYGLDLYVFLDVYRVAGLDESGLGNSIRIDAWVGDISSILPGLVPGDYLYVTSVEFPEVYLALATALM